MLQTLFSKHQRVLATLEQLWKTSYVFSYSTLSCAMHEWALGHGIELHVGLIDGDGDQRYTAHRSSLSLSCPGTGTQGGGAFTQRSRVAASREPGGIPFGWRVFPALVGGQST